MFSLKDKIFKCVTALFHYPHTGEGYAQAGAATFDTAVNWILYGQEKQFIAEQAEEERALAREAQQYDIRQRAFENLLAQRGMGLQEQGFNFGKQKWGEEFGLTKKQAKLNMKLAKQQEKRAQAQEGRAAESWKIEKNRLALSNLKNTLNSALADDIQMKQLVASRMGM